MSVDTTPFEIILRDTVPVVQGGMQWVGYAELASAVSNAGGLGIVSRQRYERATSFSCDCCIVMETNNLIVDESDSTNT